MNAIPDPKQATPHEIAIAAIKEAYEQIGRREEQLARVNEQVSKLGPYAAPPPSDPQQPYEEQLARVDEQVSKLEQDGAPHLSDPQHAFKQEHDAARHPSDHPRTDRNRSRPAVPRSLSLGGQAVRAFMALILAACIGVAAIAWQSPSYRDAARQIIASKAPQLVPILSLIENPGLAEHPRQPTLQAGTANRAPPEPAPLTAPGGVGEPAAAALSRELTQLLQTTARDYAAVRQQIEQLKTSQEQMVRANAEIAGLKAAQAQMARDNADLAEQLKAAQAQMARGNAEFAEQLKAVQAQMDRPIVGAAEQNLRPQASAPPTRPIATPTRKLAPKPSSPQARAQPKAEPISRAPTSLR
jgi:hypothetical protein